MKKEYYKIDKGLLRGYIGGLLGCLLLFLEYTYGKYPLNIAFFSCCFLICGFFIKNRKHKKRFKKFLFTNHNLIKLAPILGFVIGYILIW